MTRDARGRPEDANRGRSVHVHALLYGAVMPEDVSRAAWYAVRCVFVDFENKPWGPTDLEPGEAGYEERITLWQADSAEAAIALAEADVEEYAEALECEYTGLAQSYLCQAEPGQGAEVFSLIRLSRLKPDDYLDRFFDTGDERQRSATAD